MLCPLFFQLAVTVQSHAKDFEKVVVAVDDLKQFVAALKRQLSASSPTTTSYHESSVVSKVLNCF